MFEKMFKDKDSLQNDKQSLQNIKEVNKKNNELSLFLLIHLILKIIYVIIKTL
jgi:hypothetical protein